MRRKKTFLVVLTAVLMMTFMALAFFAALKINATVKSIDCAVKIKALLTAIQVYNYDNEGRYPTSNQWCDLLIENPGEMIEDTFRCPVCSEGTFGYAINENLYGIEQNKIPSEMVVLFEADLGRNGVGGREDLVLRHDNGCHVGFAGGDTAFITEDRIGDLRWTAD